MEDDLDNFPFDWIAEDFAAGACIPFLGAGASAFARDVAARPPTARTLALELARGSQFPQLREMNSLAAATDADKVTRRLRLQMDCENLMLVSSWVEHGLGDRPRIQAKLRDHLANRAAPMPCNGLHMLLATVAARSPMAIITTNYDDLAERALDQQGVPYDLFVVAIDGCRTGGAAGRGAALLRRAGETSLQPVRAEDPIVDLDTAAGALRLKTTVLFKIHGHIGRDSPAHDTFVITEEDYATFLGHMGQGDSLIPADLVTLLQSSRLLFLGYGLRDWNFRVLLERLNRMRAQSLRSYAIGQGVTEAERRLWTRREVEIFNADLNDFLPRLRSALGVNS